MDQKTRRTFLSGILALLAGVLSIQYFDDSETSPSEETQSSITFNYGGEPLPSSFPLELTEYKRTSRDTTTDTEQSNQDERYSGGNDTDQDTQQFDVKSSSSKSGQSRSSD